MFALFFSLYCSMFTGQWTGAVSMSGLAPTLTNIMKELGTFLTSIFGDNQMTDFGTVLANTSLIGFQQINVANYIVIISFVLALITSIGIVVMAVKGVKKAFGIFFGHIR